MQLGRHMQACLSPRSVSVRALQLVKTCLVWQATRAYLHSEAEVQEALRKAGFRVVRKDLTATR